MSDLNKDIASIVSKRGGSGDSFQAFGRIAKGFGISDSDYQEICKEYGRITEDELEKATSAGEKKEERVFVKDRFLTFVASDETVDSYGDILRVDGADLTRFKSGSGAFITSHDIRDVSGASGIIVKAVKVKNNEGSPDGKAILVTVYFPTAEEDPDSDYIFRKFKAGTLKAVSVGLQVIEAYYPEDPNERKRIGLGKYGVEVRKWAPYELSAVTVGANPNALMKRGMDEDFVKAIVKETIDATMKKTEKVAEPVKLRSYLDAFDVKVNVKL